MLGKHSVCAHKWFTLHVIGYVHEQVHGTLMPIRQHAVGKPKSESSFEKPDSAVMVSLGFSCFACELASIGV